MTSRKFVDFLNSSRSHPFCVAKMAVLLKLYSKCHKSVNPSCVTSFMLTLQPFYIPSCEITDILSKGRQFHLILVSVTLLHFSKGDDNRVQMKNPLQWF